MNILNVISRSPNAAISEIAKEIGAADRTVSANIKKLKDKNILSRIGGKKGGYWKVMWE